MTNLHDNENCQDFIQSIRDQSFAPATIKSRDRALKYWDEWSKLTYGQPLTYPVQPSVVIRFISDHMNKMNPDIDRKLVESTVKSKLGSHTWNTVRRRFYALSSYHDLKGYKNPCREKSVSSVLAMAQKAQMNKGMRVLKKTAATADIINKLIETCGSELLVDIRDKALLLVGFSSGGRRRSELSEMKLNDLNKVPGGYTIKIHHAKGDYEGYEKEYPILGSAAKALTRWLNTSRIEDGFLFRRISRYNTISGKLSPNGVNFIIKKRAKTAGLDNTKLSARSLRSGFITEAARKSIPVWEIMQLTNHKTSRSVDDYYRSGSILRNPAADLL
jgi:integrase